jgi:hypothetical protein
MVTIIHDDTMTSVPTLAVIALKVGQDCLPVEFCHLEIVGELPASRTVTTVDKILSSS